MTKRMIIVVAVLIVVFGGIFSYDFIRTLLVRHFVQNFQPPPVTIATTTATTTDWQPTLAAVGSLTAVNGVNVTTEVNGMVVAIHFKSGEKVETGQPLVQLDDSADIQDLKNNQAVLALDKIDFSRKTTLYHRAAIAKSDYDQSLANLQQAQAQVNKSEVLVGKKNIRAPFAGKLGIRQINLGQFINAGDTIVNLQSFDPLFVDFSLPEKYLQSLSIGQSISISVDAYPNEKFVGTITAMDSAITENTRSIHVRASVANKDSRLYPGSFAGVTIYLPQKKSVVVVPQTAVTYSLYGNTVYVVNTTKPPTTKTSPTKSSSSAAPTETKQYAYQRFVTVGDSKDNQVVIESGLQAGETVVVAGQNKLQEGTQVVIDNSVKLQPKPNDQLYSN